jgi:small subunit ribosomal protein S17
MNTRGNRKERSGVVVSDKMDKTVVVQVRRRFKHPLFKKYVSTTKRYKAHDENNECNIGDQVVVIETRPLSRDKRWRVKEILKKAV